MAHPPRKALIAAFVLAVALCLFFAGRLIVGAVYWSDAAHIEQPVAGWMRLGYVARSWNVPREDLLEALDLPASGLRATSLERIAQDSGVPLPVLIERVEAAIERLRAQGDGG